MSRIGFIPEKRNHPAVALFKCSHNYNFPYMLVIGKCELDERERSVIIDRTEPYDIMYFDNIKEANQAYNKAAI